MATIEHITSIKPHSNADRLELVTILGYQSIVPKGVFKVNDKVLFIQPDNVLPNDEWCSEYKKYVTTRVKAIRIRNEWSEGIVIDLAQVASRLTSLNIGEDVSDQLKITHYETSSPSTSFNAPKQGLPFNIPKTDEHRSETVKYNKLIGSPVDVTLKIDGQSWSAYYDRKTDKFGVLARRYEITGPVFTPEEKKYMDHVIRYKIDTKLKEYCNKYGLSLCIRGESYGHGIQHTDYNPHSKMDSNLAIFSVYNIDEQRYYNKNEQHYFTTLCIELDLPHVPIIEENVPLTDDLIEKYSVGINELKGAPFEGVVIKGHTFSFKVINKRYDSLK